MLHWMKWSATILALLSLLSGCALNGTKDGRGSFKGSYYQVKKGDSVFTIAYMADKDFNEIIRFNHLKPPYTIRPGQKLNLWRTAYVPPSFDGTGAGGSQNKASSKTKVVQKQSSTAVEQSKSEEYVGNTSKQSVNQNVTATTQPNEKIDKWVWPTRGRVISKFALGDQGNKGLDIAGQRGQDVSATASGVVVYAGNALRGYGNLIIIKHNEDYLSAYAHNDSLLITEGQSVKTGQKIATMGSTGTNSVRLHFEIRYKGKPVNPNNYLP
ncbi:peptidoglycan DD-metalloendopeptidase family protein [Vibrio algicola]|uniref:Peptidoglycan DD-metalloendopeptidase family protein n=1 Tax=Vibrio algicola TaxID=2662262 RepID=A0A5Q0THP5_9VIBR|nr:peptidoglycan DD-metalloendopeptidase family protein [Vibrio algicola]